MKSMFSGFRCRSILHNTPVWFMKAEASDTRSIIDCKDTSNFIIKMLNAGVSACWFLFHSRNAPNKWFLHYWKIDTTNFCTSRNTPTSRCFVSIRIVKVCDGVASTKNNKKSANFISDIAWGSFIYSHGKKLRYSMAFLCHARSKTFLHPSKFWENAACYLHAEIVKCVGAKVAEHFVRCEHFTLNRWTCIIFSPPGNDKVSRWSGTHTFVEREYFSGFAGCQFLGFSPEHNNGSLLAAEKRRNKPDEGSNQKEIFHRHSASQRKK